MSDGDDGLPNTQRDIANVGWCFWTFCLTFFQAGKSENACPTNKVVVLSAVFYLILALSERATSVQNWARQNPPFLRSGNERAQKRP
jgi:hypothetical protein